MKKEILDTPFQDSFSDFLEKGERIVWRNEVPILPRFLYRINEDGNEKIDFFEVMKWGGTVVFVLYHIINESVPYKWIVLFCLVVIIVTIISQRTERHQTEILPEYMITQKRVLFRLLEAPGKEIYEIPFSQIRNCIVVKNEWSEKGVIFFAVKNPETISFDTYGGDGIRSQPTFEDIENPDEVAQLIRQGIQNANKLL